MHAGVRAIRSLLVQAKALLKEAIAHIDKALVRPSEVDIRHYCVWAFPPTAPGVRGPGIYSGEMPYVWETILAEAGLKSISGALKYMRQSFSVLVVGRLTCRLRFETNCRQNLLCSNFTRMELPVENRKYL